MLPQAWNLPNSSSGRKTVFTEVSTLSMFIIVAGHKHLSHGQKLLKLPMSWFPQWESSSLLRILTTRRMTIPGKTQTKNNLLTMAMAHVASKLPKLLSAAVCPGQRLSEVLVLGRPRPTLAEKIPGVHGPNKKNKPLQLPEYFWGSGRPPLKQGGVNLPTIFYSFLKQGLG